MSPFSVPLLLTHLCQSPSPSSPSSDPDLSPSLPRVFSRSEPGSGVAPPPLNRIPLSNLQLDCVSPVNPPSSSGAEACSSPPLHLCTESFLSPSMSAQSYCLSPRRLPDHASPSYFCPDCPLPHICPGVPLSLTNLCCKSPPPQPGLGAVSPMSTPSPLLSSLGSRLAPHPCLPCPSLVRVSLSIPHSSPSTPRA